MPTRYLRRRFRVEPNGEESLSAALWEAGTLGLESRQGEAPDDRLVIDAWFESAESTAAAEFAESAVFDLPPAVELVSEQLVDGEDWLAAYRSQAQPFDLGRCFRVDPGEPDDRDLDGAGSDGAGSDGAGSDGPGVDGPGVDGPSGDRTRLAIPARSAFGTGSHASTRLLVELLEAEPPSGLTVLDVGTGTGVLAMVALRLGARRVVAYDIDPIAPCAARENLRRNRAAIAPHGAAPHAAAPHAVVAAARLFAGTAAALRPPPAGGGRFDLALVNVIPQRVAADLPAIAAQLVPGGVLLFSGILRQQQGGALAQAAACGLAPLGVQAGALAGDDEWVAYRLRKVAPPV